MQPAVLTVQRNWFSRLGTYLMGLFYNHLCHWLIDWFIHSLLSDPLVRIYSKHSQSQSGRARELKFGENVHLTLYVMCHLSRVTCHVSLVNCHLSHVFKKIYIFPLNSLKMFFFAFVIFLKEKVMELVSGGSVMKGAFTV